ncbi:hypothetical protein evm_014442 [Chilo suppressalis]|nr:hypothetical protein evm_014442 [Chilo suppressalis]
MFPVSEVGIDDEFLYRDVDRLAVVGLPGDPSGTGKWRARVTPVARETCRHHMAPIADLRDYELCATMLDYTPATPLPGNLPA